MSTARWIVVRTHPNCEQKAMRNLANQAFTAYRPVILEVKKVRQKLGPVIVSLFPNYLFVRIGDQFRSLSSTYGVASIVGVGGNPSIVQDQIIEDLMKREKNGIIQLPDEKKRLAVGDSVVIQAGALAGQQALVARMPVKERQRVLLALLNNKISVLVDEADIISAA